ncbi:MAG TPA: hypothetical protein VFQ07_14020 [Candidatus Polarisedimenticolia bacterium]|nr:hypothetical protein [Candidatus Polarisedimenticolia bacterium]
MALRLRRCLLVLLAITFGPVGFAAAQTEGILAPLSPSCEDNTHHIVDVCTGEDHPVWSSSIDLNALSCQTVQATGNATGLTCPGTDVTSVVAVPPACPIEVGGVEFQILDPEGTTLRWRALPCATFYQVIRGVAGEPALNRCDALHPCQSGFFCERIVGKCDGWGTCKQKPPACVEVFDPVCGCDGRTYSNSCFADESNASIRCAGACPCPPACTYDEGCIAGGPVTCRATIPAPYTGIQEPEIPRPGEAYFYFVKALGTGVVNTTTYGFTSDGRERFFSGPVCP